MIRKIYIAHPFQNKKANYQAITHICQSLVKFGIIPISPVHAFSFLHDNIPEERSLALDFCEELIEVVDEVWFFGDWQSSDGCRREMDVVKQLFKPFFVVSGWKDSQLIFEGGRKPKWMKESGGK